MIETIKYIIKITTKKQKQKIEVLIILGLICSFFEAFSVTSLLPIVTVLLNKNIMLENHYAIIFCSLLEIKTYHDFVVVCLIGIFLIYLIKNLFILFKNYLQAKYTLDFQCEIRNKVFHNLLCKDYKYFLDNNSADIIKSISNDVKETYTVLDNFLTVLIEAIISLFLILTIFLIDWKISIVLTMVIIGMLLLISGSLRPLIKKTGKESNQTATIRNRWIKQAIDGIKILKISQKNEYFEKKELEMDVAFNVTEIKHKVLISLQKIMIEMFAIVFIIIFSYLFILNNKDFELFIPSVSAVGAACLKLLPSLNQIVNNISNIQYRIPYVKKVHSLLNEREMIKECESTLPQYKKEIYIKNVSFKYNRLSKYILNKISFKIPIGKTIGIVGKSGEGKTTLIDILMGLIKPEKGNIYIDSVSIYKDIIAWRNSVGYVTQETYLLDDSILSNITFGIDENEINESKAWEALEKSQISNFVRQLPNGINTKIGDRGIRLSGGQRQRIGIARALYNNPQILIFDEATSSLDSETESAVVEAINSLYGKHTIIIISHRSVNLEQCDEIYQLKNGNIFLKTRK